MGVKISQPLYSITGAIEDDYDHDWIDTRGYVHVYAFKWKESHIHVMSVTYHPSLSSFTCLRA